ncbi:hypothetical protein, partial [Comamonas thiooxydans]|uniref:hypothetical protein n=1 Tax=Comamonas thiooxydans TaxID=363952 RepID=UPI001040D44F
MQDIISTLKNALQQAEAGLEVAVGRLTMDGTERGGFKPSEVLALACVREALAMPVTCLHQIQEPEADIWPCVNIDVDDSGKITNAKLYSPGLPAGNHDVYPVRVPYMDEHTEAWRACVDELEKAVPGFMSLGNMNGIECAVAAIRGLSERAKHQEPAAAEQAAWHAGLDEGRAQAARPVFVPDDMPSTEANTKYGESYGVDWVYEGKTAAPAAVAWSMPAEPTEQMIEVLMAGEDRLRARHGDDLPKQRAKDRYRALLSLAATPACDTPNYCRSV